MFLFVCSWICLLFLYRLYFIIYFLYCCFVLGCNWFLWLLLKTHEKMNCFVYWLFIN
jgi:hypothetical protein